MSVLGAALLADPLPPPFATDPGFPDKAGFGRRVLAMSPEQAYAEMCVPRGCPCIALANRTHRAHAQP
jgi:lactam utilization protein B